MIKRLSLFIAFTLFGLAGLSVQAQDNTPTYAYPTTHLRWNEVTCHIERGAVRLGNNWRGEVVYTVNRGRIFAGYSTSSFDVAFTLRDNKLYIGDSYFTDAITYSLDGNSIYVGDSNFPLDIAYTIVPDRNRPGVINIFRDDSISPFDIVTVLQGDPTPTEIFALLLTMGLL
ncbi:MAG TPA: hypothetical protein EYO58_09800 [Flavobacteriales bacterium]|nr:hypothetical protein [Flavobacteriales bacterium]